MSTYVKERKIPCGDMEISIWINPKWCDNIPCSSTNHQHSRARRVDPDPTGSGSKISILSGPGPEIFWISRPRIKKEFSHLNFDYVEIIVEFGQLCRISSRFLDKVIEFRHLSKFRWRNFFVEIPFYRMYLWWIFIYGCSIKSYSMDTEDFVLLHQRVWVSLIWRSTDPLLIWYKTQIK